MSKVVLISVATSVGLGLLSLHLLKQMKDGEATIAELKAQVATLEQRPPPQPLPPPGPAQFVIAPVEVPKVAGVATKEPRTTIGAVASVGAMPLAPPPDREAHLRMMREHRERQRQLMQDPEYREAMRVQARSNLARQYPGVIQELGLDTQQADEFFNLLAEQQLRTNERMEPLWETMNGGDANDPAAMQARNRKIHQAAMENRRADEAEMAASFGQDKLQSWKEYQSSMGMRYQLDHMRNTLSSHGVPLSEELSKPMLKAMAQANQVEADAYSAAVSRGAAPALAARVGFNGVADGSNMERHLEDQKKRNQRVLDAISPYLSFEQRSAIEKEQEAQLKMQEAQYRIMRAQRKANGSNNGNATTYFVEGSGALIAQP